MAITDKSTCLARTSPHAWQVVLLAACYFLAASAGIYLTREASNVAALWPANAVLLGILLRAGPGQYGAYIVACFIANLCANMTFGVPAFVSVGFAICNIIETLIAFVLLRRVLPSGWSVFTSEHLLVFSLVTVIVAPLVGATLGSLLLHFSSGTPVSSTLKTWWLADATGFLLITPAILVWNREIAVNIFRQRTMESLAIGASIVVLAALVFTQTRLAPLISITPLLLWSAFRLGTVWTVIASLVVCTIAVLTSTYGIGPLGSVPSGSTIHRVVFLQLYLSMAIIVPIIVALMQDERHRLIEELARKNAELERYAYTVSHDLKAPIITIKGFLAHLREDLASGAQEDVAQDLLELDKAANGMDQLLQDLLELSRQGVVAARDEKFSLPKLVSDIVEDTPYKASIAISADANLPLVYGDTDRLAIVVRNILDNAQKFSGTGKAMRVDINITQDKGELVCRISDRGIGIPPGQLERIFELFERLEPGIAGSGVGLSIVKRIVEAHGGRVWIESDGINQGASVNFTLPSIDADPTTAENGGQLYALHPAGRG